MNDKNNIYERIQYIEDTMDDLKDEIHSLQEEKYLLEKKLIDVEDLED